MNNDELLDLLQDVRKELLGSGNERDFLPQELPLVGRIDQAAAFFARAPQAGWERDAKRYRWLRNRLVVKPMQSMKGQFRPGLDVRIGYSFMDSRPIAETRDKTKDAEELDAAIDAAIAAAPSPITGGSDGQG